MKTFSLLKLLSLVTLCTVSSAQSTPFQEYSNKVNSNKIELLTSAPPFAFTVYSETEYKQLYYKNYKEYQKVGFELSEQKAEYKKYLARTLKLENNKYLVTNKEFLNLVLTSEHKKKIYFGNLTVVNNLISANNDLIKITEAEISVPLSEERNEKLKLFLEEIKSFNASLERLMSDKFTNKDYSNIVAFSHKYLR